MKEFLFILLILMSFSSWGISKHLVFELDGTIVKEIDLEEYEKFRNKDQLFSIASETKDLYFAILPFAPQLLLSLSKKVEIHVDIASEYTQEETWKILKKIHLPGGRDETLASLMRRRNFIVQSKEGFTNGAVDLSKISSDYTNSVLISTSKRIFEKPVFERNRIEIGKSFHYFESFDLARDKLKAERRYEGWIPKTHEEWKVDQAKLAYLWQLLIDSRAFSTNNLSQAMLQLKPKVKGRTAKGLVWANSGFMDSFPAWKFDSDRSRIEGCRLISMRVKEPPKEQAMSECLAYYGSDFTFKKNLGSMSVEGCFQSAAGTGAIIGPAEISNCISSKRENIGFYWIGKNRTRCASYLDKVFFIQEEGSSLCGDQHVIEENDNFRILTLYFNGQSYSEFTHGVLELADSSVIPAPIYASYESISIAETLMHRLHSMFEPITDSGADYDFYKDSRIVMAINFKVFDAIKQNGFLNQHVTKKSSAYFNPEDRADAEDSLARLRLEAAYGSIGRAAHDLRPKYAYLFLDKPKEGMGWTKVQAQYGNIFLKFREIVKRRSTFTPGDSLDLWMKNSQERGRSFYYKSPSRLKIQESAFWEAQIWGGLKISDVEYALVNCPGSAVISLAKIQHLQAANLEVYQCRTEVEDGSVVNVYKGQRL